MQIQGSQASNHASARQSERESHPHVAFLEEQDSFNLQKLENREEQYALPYTISADLVGNRRFLTRQGKYTFFIVLIIFVLRLLPSPLTITSVSNDPSVFVEEPCPPEALECIDVEEGYESIVIKKLNPLERQLKYFIRLNLAKMEQLSQYYDSSKIQLDKQITWIDIYASRNGAIYGQVIYEKDGSDIYEVLFDGQPLIFIGEVHILSEQSYIIRIYKRIKKVKVPANRLLQPAESSSPESASNDTLAGQQPKNQMPSANSTQNEQSAAGNDSDNSPNKPQIDVQEPHQQNQLQSNTTSHETTDTTQSETIGKKEQQTEPIVTPQPQVKVIGISVPITVEMVRYSEFYTIMELAIRYVTFLFALYVRGQTSNSPSIFHFILLFVANPLIFIEIAFPNSVSNCISNICSSAYIAYFAVFMFYTHRKLKNRQAEVVLIAGKIVIFLGLLVINVMRQMHLVNQTRIEVIEIILVALVMLPLVKHLWKLFFIKSRTILHRSMLFISLTCYYLTFLFLTGYIVPYGWKKIIFYLIVQTYGVELCYLTCPAAESDKGRLQESSSSSQEKEKHERINDRQPEMHSEPNILPQEDLNFKEEHQPQVSESPFVRVQ